MNYTIMIFEDSSNFAARTDPARKAQYWGDTMHYLQALKDAGVFVGGAGLLPPEAATTLRYKGGEPLVQDGPFPDTKEQLGGFFIVRVADLDAALAWAKRFPRQDGVVVEVRPNLPENGL